MANKDNDKEKKEPKRKVPAATVNLNMYIYGNYGVEKDSNANIFYLGERWIGADWMCPGLFDEFLLQDSEELKKLVDNRDELKKRIAKIFKEKYLMLLWTRFNSIRDIIADYVTEKINTAEWDTAVEEALKAPAEKTVIEFK